MAKLGIFIGITVQKTKQFIFFMFFSVILHPERRKAMPQRTEEELLMHRLRHKFHQTAAEYSLIEEGDRILVAVSGGKDSLALLELMAARVRV